MALDANTTSHMILALVAIVIALCSRGGSGNCGGGHVVSCCGGCVAWQSWSHGLTVAVAGGSSSHGRVMEVVAVMLCCVVVAAWHGSHGYMA